MRDPIIFASNDFLRDLAEGRVEVAAGDAGPVDDFLILSRSTTSQTAAHIARERIAAAHQATAIGLFGNIARNLNLVVIVVGVVRLMLGRGLI